MSINNLEAKVTELKELESFIAEIEEQAEAIRDTIKEEMKERDTEELICGKYIVRWTSVLTSRFDAKKFKEKFGEQYYKDWCTKEVSSRRFVIA